MSKKHKATTKTSANASKLELFSRSNPLIFALIATFAYCVLLALGGKTFDKTVPEYASSLAVSIPPIIICLLFCAVSKADQKALQEDQGKGQQAQQNNQRKGQQPQGQTTLFTAVQTFQPTVSGAKALCYAWPMLIPIAFTLVFKISPLAEKGLVENWPIVLLFSVLSAIGVAMAEELVFRKIIISGFAHGGYSPMKTLLFSAVIFGLFHLVNLTNNPAAILSVGSQVIYTFCYGLIFGLIFMLSKRIWVPIVAHALLDGADFISMIFNTAQPNAVAGDISVGVALILVGIALPAAIFALLKVRKMQRV